MMKRTVHAFLIILAIVPALFCLPSCEKRDLVEEKMELLEGKWASLQNGMMPDHPAYYAEITKEEGRWIFRFHILDRYDGSDKYTTYVQGVTWSPVVGDYVFENLWGPDTITHYESDRIVLASFAYLNSYGDRGIRKYTWKRVSGNL